MKQDIGAIVKKLFKRSQGVSKPFFGADAYEDWKKLLIIFLAINILVLIWSGYLFWQINQGNIFAVPTSSSTAVESTTKNNLRNILNL